MCYLLVVAEEPETVSKFMQSMGAAQRNVSQQIIRAFPMVMPTDVLAGAFAETAGPALDEIRCLTEQNQTLRKARDILLPKLINGTISA